MTIWALVIRAPLPRILLLRMTDEGPNEHVHSHTGKGRQVHMSSFEQPCIQSALQKILLASV